MNLGAWGEAVAERYLIKKGYRITERNFRCKAGEIDIIAYDGTRLVFVEVKTRRNQKYGLPCEAVNASKIRHLIKTAAYYMMIHSMESRDARIDIIEIIKAESGVYFRHIKGITS